MGVVWLLFVGLICLSVWHSLGLGKLEDRLDAIEERVKKMEGE